MGKSDETAQGLGIAVGFIIGAITHNPYVGYAAGIAATYGLREAGVKTEIPDPAAPVSEDRELQLNSTHTQRFIPVVYGTFRVGGVYAFLGLPQRNWLTQLIVWSEGEVDLVYDHYLNGWDIDDDTDPDNPYYDDWVAGMISETGHEGQYDQDASTLLQQLHPGEWTPNHRLRNTAYSIFFCQWTPNIAAHGLPQWTAKVKGHLCLDPRTDLTEFSDNPALVLYDYLTAERYGVGIPTDEIDEDSFIAAANHCEEDVTLAGESVDRYKFDGVVDPSRPNIQNIQQILSSCRGLLVYSGGIYKLIIDQEESATFTFTERNIIGRWRFDLGSKEARWNVVKARYFDKDANYTTQTQVYQDLDLRETEDNGATLEGSIDLPGTTDWRRAQMIARLDLNQSRFSIVCTFTATIEGLRAEAGDIVRITHATPGWTNKEFRVVSVNLLESNEVRITVREYDDSVYQFGTIEARSTPPIIKTLFLGAGDPPGAPMVCSSSQTRAGGQPKTKAVTSWKAPLNTDATIIDYELEYRPDGGDWTFAGRTPDLALDILDLDAGVYDVRVRSINMHGIRSAWSTTNDIGINANTAPPALTGLEVMTIHNLAILTWTLPTDDDILHGGQILIRHTDDKTSPAWSSGHWIGQRVAGNVNIAIVPLLAGSYMLKAINAAGNHSLTAVSVVTDADQVILWTAATTITENPGWSGSKTDVQVDTSKLELTESAGEVDPEGTYNFNTAWNVGSLQTFRVRGILGTNVITDRPNIDSWTSDLDDREDFDGAAGAQADARLYIRTQDSGLGIFGPWMPLTVGEYEFWQAQFKLVLSSTDTDFNIQATTCQVHRDQVNYT